MSSPKKQPNVRTASTLGDPLRRAKRKKYISRACQQCRRRKLRCSGEPPCERCVGNDEHCSLIDDDGPADKRRRPKAAGVTPGVTTTVTRPTAAAAAAPRKPPASPLLADLVTLLLDRLNSIEQQACKMNRALEHAGIRLPEADFDDDDDDDNQSDSNTSWLASTIPSPEPDTFAAETALTQPVAGLRALLADEVAGVTPLWRPPPSPEPFQPPGIDTSPAATTDDRLTRPKPPPPPPSGPTLPIKCGSIACFLPNRSRHDEYLDFFFTQLNPFMPCLNEPGVRRRSGLIYERAEASVPSLHPDLGPYLALLFSLYACVDAYTYTPAPGPQGFETTDGYPWFRQAQDLVGRRQIPAASGDMTGIQIVILQSMFLAQRGNLDSAYIAIGRAPRLCYQHGVNNAANWTKLTPFRLHIRQRVLYVAFCLDRRLSFLSGRPYAFNTRDIFMAQPDGIVDADASVDQPLLPPPSRDSCLQPWIGALTTYGQFTGRVWDQLACPTVSNATDRSPVVEALDSDIAQWLIQFECGTALDPDSRNHIQKQQRLIIRTLMYDLRLLLRRKEVIHGGDDPRVRNLCGELGSSIVDEIHRATFEPTWGSSYYLKAHAPTILFSPIIVLATLIIRNHACSTAMAGYQLRFQQAVDVVRQLSAQLAAAARIETLISDIVRLTNARIRERNTQATTTTTTTHVLLDDFDLFSTELQTLTDSAFFLESSPTGQHDWDSGASGVGKLVDFSCWNDLVAGLGVGGAGGVSEVSAMI